MNFKSQISKSYRILHIIGAVAWFLCAAVAAAVLAMIVRSPDKNTYQIILMAVLILLIIVFLYNSAALLSQIFKSLEITDNGNTILLKKIARTYSLHPEEIRQVRLEEKYLLYSFSTKPRSMLVVDAPGVSWQVRSDIITYYDRVLNYFMEFDKDESV